MNHTKEQDVHTIFRMDVEFDHSNASSKGCKERQWPFQAVSEG